MEPNAMELSSEDLAPSVPKNLALTQRVLPLSSLLCHGANLSRKGAFGKPGEIHSAFTA